jgi:topoisomerase IA-like protein
MALPAPLQNISSHARWLYPLVVLGLAILLGNIFGLGLGLLVFGGGVLGGGIWLIWSSLQGLMGEAPLTLEEAISLGAPSAEEEQKRAVLRALKDLEYERAVGKINDDDYTQLAEHYRKEAKRLLRAVDQDLNPERERAERILEERLARASNGHAPSAASTRATKNAAAASDADVVAETSSELPPAKSPSSDTAL